MTTRQSSRVITKAINSPLTTVFFPAGLRPTEKKRDWRLIPYYRANVGRDERILVPP